MDTKSIAAKFTLGKNDRLKSRKLIGQLFKEGKPVSVYPYRLLYSVSPGAPGLRAGFTVSSRNFKKAVDRNRIKRIMREAYRLNRHLLPNDGQKSLTLFFIFTGKEIFDFETAQSKMLEVINRLLKQLK